MPTPPDPPTVSLPPADDDATRLHGEPGRPAEAPPAPADRYDLGGFIAVGGMGEVYAARDRVLGREVAVKVLRAGYAPGSAVAARFVDEARIAGQLQHPGIPPVHDLGTLAGGRPFLAMKLIKGRTLADLLTEGGADPDRLLGVFEGVCQAVGYAHAKGVVHRDLKPANVMVGAFGEVQVMDWGLAKVLRDAGPAAGGDGPDADDPGRTAVHNPPSAVRTPHPNQTQAWSLLGTPAYMPPEQAKGEVGRVDARADVFALGAVLCELLTGRPPYTGTFTEVHAQAVTALTGPALARLAGSGADPELVDLCRRCLAADPADRPADAGAVAAAVAAHRAGVADRLRRAEVDRAEAAVREAEGRKRRRAQRLLAAAGAALVAAGLGFGWWQDKQAGDRRAEALARQVEDERRAAAERERAGRNAEAVATLLGACEAALRDDDPDRAEAALAEADRRLSEGGGDAHRDRLDRARADLTLVRELDRIEGEMWTSILQSAGSGVNTEATVDAVFARQRAALAAYGVVPGRAPAAEAGRRLTGSAVAGRALASLDMWLDQESSAEVRQYLRAVSAAADPDPYRDAVRDAVLARDGRRHGELARQPDALRQPHWFADMILAGLPREHEAWGRKVLESALARRPGDLGLLMTLGNYVTADLARAAIGKKEAETGRAAGVALRWHQAAVAAHPRNPFARFALGGSLLFAGDHDGAFPHIEAAARLDPTSILARQMLANLYIRRGDLDRAVDELRAVVRLAPNDAGHARALDQALDHALARQAGRLAPPPREAKPKPPGQ